MSEHIVKNTEKHIRFYVLLTILLVLLMARYGLQIGIPRIVLTATIAIIALLGDRDEILAIAMCCIPLHEAVDFFYALVACAGAYVVKNHQRVRINLAICIVLLLIAWELLHCISADFSIITFLISVVPMIFLAVILCANVSDVDYGFIARVMAAVVAATCVILLTNLIVRSNFNITVAIEGLRRLGLVDENEKSEAMLGGTLNPNALGIICVLATTGLFQLRVVRSNKKTDIVVIIILITFGALTSSRTFLVCLLLMSFLLILGQPGYRRQKIRLLGLLICLLGAALLLLNWLFPALLEYYLGRFAVEDITTGREELLVKYHDYIMDNANVLFFGIGRYNYTQKLTEVYRIARNIPHNSIQEIIVAWGLPGLILFALLLVMLLQQARKYNSQPILLNYIPFLIILVKSMAGHILTSSYTILALSYAYLSLSQNFKLKKET